MRSSKQNIAQTCAKMWRTELELIRCCPPTHLFKDVRPFCIWHASAHIMFLSETVSETDTQPSLVTHLICITHHQTCRNVFLPTLLFAPVFRNKGTWPPNIFGDFQSRYIYLLYICVSKKSEENPSFNQRWKHVFSIHYERKHMKIWWLEMVQNQAM